MRLEATIRDELEHLHPSPALNATPSRLEIPKAILLKPPVSAVEKGVLYVPFEDQWMRLLTSGRAADIARRYDLLLGPSWSPPHDLSLLLATKLWPGPVYSLLSNFEDADTMRRLSDRLVPIPLLASSWVDPDAAAPYLGLPKEHDLVMLAQFGRYKRHWLLFHALRRLPRRFRVLLLGVPYGDRGEEALMAETRAFGVQDRFELHIRPTRTEVAEALARSRVSLIFSRQEGSCLAVSESLFADTPVGLFRHARIGSKAFLNGETGVLLDQRGLALQLEEFVERSAQFRARTWALANISAARSLRVLNDTFAAAAHRAGRPWSHKLVPFYRSALPYYADAATEDTLRPCYDEYERAFNIRLGKDMGRWLAEGRREHSLLARRASEDLARASG